ncbi:MAG TPA: hypothetical protein VF120_14325 [Ktedonobacterales bacterium]
MGVIYGPLLLEQVKSLPTAGNFTSYDDVVGDQLPEQQCTYCGKQMTYPGVFWGVYEVDVWLHPACVVEWMIRLMRDVHQIECTTTTRVTAHPVAADQNERS